MALRQGVRCGIHRTPHRRQPMKRVLPLIAILALAACGGGGAQLSLSGRAGGSAAAAAASPTALTLSNGITIDHVRIALREVELERASATPDDTRDLQEYEAGPFVLDLSGAALNGTVQQVTVKEVPAGTYREIKFKGHPPSTTDSTNAAGQAKATLAGGPPPRTLPGPGGTRAHLVGSRRGARRKEQ